MTALHLADAREAADLAAFLARLIHYDRAAAVRVQAGGGVLAVFGRPAPFDVLAVRTARLTDAGASDSGAGSGPAAAEIDVTVSAGQLADAIDAAIDAAVPATGRAPSGAVPGASGASDAPGSGVPADRAAALVAVPDAVTGPPWTGVLPPRGGWRRVPGLPGPEALHRAVAAAVAEFRERDAALPEERRTRAERDRIGREIWSRTLGDTGLPLRAAHAAQSLGFLRPVRAHAAVAPGGPAAGPVGAPAAGESPKAPVLLAAGGWLRLRTPYGSIAVRSGGLPGLSVMPV